VPVYCTTYGSTEAGTQDETKTESLAGRVLSKRASGAKLLFYDLHNDGKKVQVMCDARYVRFCRYRFPLPI
jgi:lysyl-tRNA synthetase class 2